MYSLHPKIEHIPNGYEDIGKETSHITTTWVLSNNSHIETVKSFCRRYGLVFSKKCCCHATVTGNAESYNHMLQTSIHKFTNDQDTYHFPITSVSITLILKDKVLEIIGLNNFPYLTPYTKVQGLNPDKAKKYPSVVYNSVAYNSVYNSPNETKSRDLEPRVIKSFNPLELASLYNFPGNDGEGQKIGIMELGGGYVLSDIQTYFNSLGITSTPRITSVSVDGARNNPNDTSGANYEVYLDIEVIAAIVPKADIYVYFAPNSFQGFYNAINAAINDNCSIISISWGAPESQWGNSNLNSYNNLFKSAADKNITIAAAAGDNGSSDGLSGLNVDYPSSSPYVLACGGTRLDDSGVYIVSEMVWNMIMAALAFRNA